MVGHAAQYLHERGVGLDPGGAAEQQRRDPLDGHLVARRAPGEQVASGYVTLTLNNTSLPGGKNVGNLAVELIGPGGQTFYMLTPASGVTATSLTSAVFALPPSFLTGVLSGTYTLAVADFTPGDVGQLVSWSVTLVNSPSSTPTVLATTYPAANGTYQVAIASPLADGTYTLVAQTKNLAGTPN